MRAVTFVVGSVAEAWAEFRTHKARVLMSLIGVALAVAALTAVFAIGAVAQQSVTEQFERQQGRPALLSINSPYKPDSGEAPADTSAFAGHLAEEMTRYDIRYWSRLLYTSGSARMPDGVQQLSVTALDQSWGAMHRVRIAQGSWFVAEDATRLAPAVVVDTVTWKALGSPDLRTHPTMRITAPGSATAVIIGVTPGGYPGSYTAYMLYDQYLALTPDLTPAEFANQYGTPQYEAWVPPAHARALTKRLSSDLGRAAGDGFQVDVNRQDYQAQGGDDPLLIFKVVVGAAAGLILVLGALGLLNISLVTVRTRIREIGIRRSFGATAGRVFFGVMMESVVATVAAGIVGVLLSILALRNPIVTGYVEGLGLQDLPPFPISAALLGLAASVGVGALAGLLPALIAVRVKPIDAIRY